MERAEDRHGVVPPFLVFVRVVVARAALDAVGEAVGGHALAGDGRDGGDVHGHAAEPRVRAHDELRVGAGPAREVEEARAAREVEHRHHAAADRHRAAAHREREAARALGVVAEVQLGTLHGTPRARELREAAPGGVDVLIVADRLREVGGAAGDERELPGVGVEVGVLVLAEEAGRHAGVEQQAEAAGRGAQLARERVAVRGAALLGERLEHAQVERGEQHGAAVERAREVHDLGNRFRCHVFFLVQQGPPRSSRRPARGALYQNCSDC